MLLSSSLFSSHIVEGARQHPRNRLRRRSLGTHGAANKRGFEITKNCCRRNSADGTSMCRQHFVHHPWWTYVNTFCYFSVCWSRVYASLENCAIAGSFRCLKKASYRNEHSRFHHFPCQRFDSLLVMVGLDPRHGCRGLPLFMEDKSAGIEVYAGD